MPDGYGGRRRESSKLLCWKEHSCSVAPTSTKKKVSFSSQHRKIGVVHFFPYRDQYKNSEAFDILSCESPFTNFQFEFISYKQIAESEEVCQELQGSHTSSLDRWFYYICTDLQSSLSLHSEHIAKYAETLARTISLQALQFVAKEIKSIEIHNSILGKHLLNDYQLYNLPGTIDNRHANVQGNFQAFPLLSKDDSVYNMVEENISRTVTVQSSISQDTSHYFHSESDISLNTINKSDILLFFIHGLGGSSRTWKFQLSYFSDKGYEVLALDLIGHGSSATPDSPNMYTFKHMMKDVLTIFDCYAKTRNVIIAHSYGCAFAACLCQQRPHLIQQLVLLSGGRPKAIKPRQGLSALLPVWGLTILKPFLSHVRESRRIGHLAELARIASLPRYVLQHILAGQNWPQGGRKFYHNLTIPTLLIYGLRDQFISLDDELEMERTLPCAHLETVSHAGHSVMLDAPDKVNKVIFEFLQTDED